MHHAFPFLRMSLLSTTFVHQLTHDTWLIYYRVFLCQAIYAKSEFAPVYIQINQGIQGDLVGGRPFSIDQYTYGEAVRSVMKREVEVKVPARAEGPRSKYFPLYK